MRNAFVLVKSTTQETSTVRTVTTSHLVLSSVAGLLTTRLTIAKL